MVARSLARPNAEHTLDCCNKVAFKALPNSTRASGYFRGHQLPDQLIRPQIAGRPSRLKQPAALRTRSGSILATVWRNGLPRLCRRIAVGARSMKKFGIGRE